MAQSRSFYQGEDAHRAIVALGLVASMTNASRLVVAWDQADLQQALQLPGPALPPGLVVLDAPRDGEHEIGWHPVELTPAETRPDGLPWPPNGVQCGGSSEAGCRPRSPIC